MNFQRTLSFATAILLAGTASWAAVVKGYIQDSAREPLPGTSVQLISLPDSLRAAYQLTDENGAFILKKIKPGKYTLLAQMAGMDDVEKPIDITDTTKLLDLGKIVLLENAVTLKEAVITSVKAAVVAKEDTLEFNAGSFKTAQNATVNDLLKKLPGVEVESDGSIKSNGKSITKILVNGKEFFGDDPQAATKNLPSNIVDKVQVVDRKSDFARLTGVDDGEEETVINLTVKKNMNDGWFGNVGAAYGTDDHYNASFVVNNFNNGNQITILGGANNINEMGFSDRGRGRFRDFGNSGGINTTQRFGINFNVGNEDIFRIGGNVSYTHTDRKSTKRSETQYLFPDSVSYQSAGSRTRDRGHNINSDFRLKWEIDKNNTIEFRPNFGINIRNTVSNDSTHLFAGDPLRTHVNRNFNSQNNKGTSVNAGGNFIFNHKFESHPGRSFSTSVNYSFSNTPQKATTWSDIAYYLNRDDDEELYRFLDNRTWSNNIEGRLTWTEPLGDVKHGNFLDFSYRIKYQWNNADKLTYNLPEPENAINFEPAEFERVPAGAILDDKISNSFRNAFFNQEIQVGYKKVNKNYNLDAGVLFAPSSSKSTDLINSARNIPERWVWNVSPYARFRYKFDKKTSLRANYRARTSQPSMNQLQPVADVSNPLSIVQGNPDLKPTFTQSLQLGFNNYNADTQQAINTFINGSFALNTVVNKTTTYSQTGGRYTTYENADGNYSLMGMFMLNRPFTNRKWRFNVRMHANFQSSPGYNNGEFNRSGNLRLSPTAGMTFSCDVFQITFNPEYSFSRSTSTLARQKNQNTQSYGFRSDASLNLPFGLSLNTDIRFANSTGFSAGYDSKTWLWNAELAYSVLRDKSLTFSVKGYDLLGQTKDITRSVSNSMIVDSQVNSLTRYFLFGVAWNFNTLQKKNKGPQGEDMEFGPGPGQRSGNGGQRPSGPPPAGMRPGGF